MTANFGLTTRSTVYGVVFYDENGNGQHEPNEKGISAAKISLDQNQVAYTDFEGVYSFDALTAGAHTIQLDVNSIPLQYLPSVRIRNEVNVEEGTTYVFQIPLKKKVE